MKRFKTFLNESAADIGGTDFEVLLVCGVYTNAAGIKPENLLVNEELSDTAKEIHNKIVAEGRVNKTQYNTITNKGKPAGFITGAIAADKITSAKVAIQTGGDTSLSVSPLWSSQGAKDNTPKTDVVLGKTRYSVKAGAARLMSPGLAESTAVFLAAKQSLKLKGKTKRIRAEIKNLFNTVEEDGVFSDRTLTKNPENYSQALKNGKDKLVKSADKMHKEATVIFNDFLNNNPDMKIEYIREAMTGAFKFGGGSPEDPKPATNHIAVPNRILGVSDSGDVKENVPDDGYCNLIANKSNIAFSVKTNSQKKGGEKTGHYFWNTIMNISIPDMLKLKESIDIEELPISLASLTTLSEALLSNLEEEIKDHNILTEGIMDNINAVISKISNMWKAAMQWVTESIDNIMEFFGFEVNVRFKNQIYF